MIDDLSLRLPAGGRVGTVGPSGAGKTTIVGANRAVAAGRASGRRPTIWQTQPAPDNVEVATSGNDWVSVRPWRRRRRTKEHQFDA